jgi:PAS domain S-box-containing protein
VSASTSGPRSASIPEIPRSSPPEEQPIRASILLVDDQPANLLVLEAILEPLGHRLVRAISGKEALKQVLTEDFAAILLDVRMPVMDGFETALLIKQRERSSHVPIIFLTANDETIVETARVYHHGAVDFLRKPLNPDILRSKVAVFVDLYLRGEKIKQQEAQLHRQALEQTALEEREAQQARIFALFRQAPALIASLRGPTHVYDFANAPYLELLGGRDVVGLPAREALPELNGHAFADLLDRAYRSGEPVSLQEVRADVKRRGDGVKEERFFNFVVQPLRSPTGPVDSILVHAVEVTPQVLAQAALRKSEAKFRRVAESGMIGMAFVTLEGAVTDANDAFLAMIGSDRRELQAGKIRWREMTPPEWAPADEKALDQLRAGGVAMAYEKEFQRRDGRRLPVILGAARLEGSTTEAVAFVLDDTERKRAEKERESLVQSLARSNEDLHRFAYATSHDLKAPLRGIGYLVEWLEEDMGPTLNDAAREKLNLLRGRAQRMGALIDGILDYSRAGRPSDDQQQVDVRGLVEEAFDLVAPLPGATLDLAPDLPILETDRASLQQVFMNLIGNALKHAGRTDAAIRVGGVDAGASYEFTVADNGQGIAPEYHQKIWGLFQTLKARDRVDGAGIGLSVVKKIVESRGGRAWVESALGQGATFHFTWQKRRDSR